MYNLNLVLELALNSSDITLDYKGNVRFVTNYVDVIDSYYIVVKVSFLSVLKYSSRGKFDKIEVDS